MEDKGFTKKQIIIIVLGVIFTVFSLCFYILLNINWLNILCGFICFLYTIFLMYFQLYNKEEFTPKQRIKYPTIILVIFYSIFITLISILNPLGKFCLDYVLWVLFLGASILPVFYFFDYYFFYTLIKIHIRVLWLSLIFIFKRYGSLYSYKEGESFCNIKIKRITKGFRYPFML